ncbi:MAG: hexitol phosphatase HxpB [Candidatus Pacebacteria bacterium]|nr:hexitol phosphatase HxpB [Candidatus Paceibacterota bacterium]
MIKAVIFDMDGLLIDSEPLWQEAEVNEFIKVGVPISKERAEETMGLRIDMVVEYWFSRYPWKNISKEIVEKNVIENVIEIIKIKGKAMPGVEKIAEFFTKEKIPIAIASASPIEIIKVVLGKILIGKYIKIICSAENELFSKPHPGVYLTAANKLGVKVEDCLVFEDTVNGLIAAKAAQMKCVAVPNKFNKGDKRFCVADMVIPSLKDFHSEYLKNL